MQITFGNSILCDTSTRNSSGDAIGPKNLLINETPGNQVYEYIGSDRIDTDKNKPNRGTVSFGVTRIFSNIDTALGYVASITAVNPEPAELKIGNRTILEKAAMTGHQVSMVGCAVAETYNFEG